MARPRAGLSHLGLQAGFGTRIWSPTGYLAARYFHPVMALLMVLILCFSLAPHFPPALAVIPVGAYLIYLAARHLLMSRHEEGFYHPRLQFVRAQVSLLGIFLLHWMLVRAGVETEVWLLYIPGLMIVSLHHATPVYLANVLLVWLMLVAAYLQPGLPGLIGADGAPFSPATVAARCLGIGLIAFVIHYLMRCISARDARLSVYEALQGGLARRDEDNQQSDDGSQIAFETAMDVLQAIRSGILWYDAGSQYIRVMREFCRSADKAPSPTPDAEWSVCDPVGEIVHSGRPLVLQSAQCRPAHRLTLYGHPAETAVLPPHTCTRLVVPVSDDKAGHAIVLGMLYFDFDRQHTPRASQLEDYVAGIAALSMHIVPLLRHAREIGEIERALRITDQVTTNLTLNVILDYALNVVVETLGFEFAIVALVDADERHIRAVKSRNVPRDWVTDIVHPVDGPDIQADVVRTQQQEVLAGWDPRFNAEMWHKYNHQRMIRVFTPIVGLTSHGQRVALGTIEAGYLDSTRHAIEPEQRRMLSVLARRMFAPIQNARLLERAERRVENLSKLQEIGSVLALAYRHQQEALHEAAHTIHDRLGADLVVLYRYDRQTQSIVESCTYGKIIGRGRLHPPSPDAGILAHILATGNPYYQPDVAGDPKLVHVDSPHDYGRAPGSRRTFCQRQGVASFAGLPLAAEDQVVGVLCANYREHKPFTDDDRLALQIAARFAGIALRNVEMIELVREEIRERERRDLAARLHDSLNSTLPALRFFSESARDYVAQGCPERATQFLLKLEDEVRRAQRDIDANVFALRAGPPPGYDLHQGLLHLSNLP